MEDTNQPTALTGMSQRKMIHYLSSEITFMKVKQNSTRLDKLKPCQITTNITYGETSVRRQRTLFLNMYIIR